MTDDTDAPKRRPGGRPRKAPDEQRGERLPGIRLTSAERAHVEEQAARAGLDLSEFCRRAILRRRIAPAASATDEAALVALNRVGVLLNQIAKRLNAGGTAPAHLVDVLDQVRAAVTKLAGPRDGS